MPRERNTNYREIAEYVADKCKEGKWKLFLIVSEGDKTERHYFKEFEARYKKEFDERNLHVRFVDRKNSAHSDPKHVYDTLEKVCEEFEGIYELREYDELWLVIDVDDYENRKDTISDLMEKCENEPLYHLALNNPCFEIWAMLHFTDLDADVRNHIRDHSGNCAIKDYIKSFPVRQRPKKCKSLLALIHGNRQPLYENMVKHIREAIPRARKMTDCLPPDKDNICMDDCVSIDENNICTDVYKLMEKLIA